MRGVPGTETTTRDKFAFLKNAGRHDRARIHLYAIGSTNMYSDEHLDYWAVVYVAICVREQGTALSEFLGEPTGSLLAHIEQFFWIHAVTRCLKQRWRRD